MSTVNRPRPVEKQAALLLRALHSIYVALAALACANLVTLLGAGLVSAVPAMWLRVLAGLGIALGFVGARRTCRGLREFIPCHPSFCSQYSRRSRCYPNATISR
jgi:hypothetical protein